VGWRFRYWWWPLDVRGRPRKARQAADHTAGRQVIAFSSSVWPPHGWRFAAARLAALARDSGQAMPPQRTNRTPSTRVIATKTPARRQGDQPGGDPSSGPNPPALSTLATAMASAEAVATEPSPDRRVSPAKRPVARDSVDCGSAPQAGFAPRPDESRCADQRVGWISPWLALDLPFSLVYCRRISLPPRLPRWATGRITS